LRHRQNRHIINPSLTCEGLGSLGTQESMKGNLSEYSSLGKLSMDLKEPEFKHFVQVIFCVLRGDSYKRSLNNLESINLLRLINYQA